jgi:hypothetical protein
MAINTDLLNNIYQNMPYYNELQSPEAKPSIELKESIDINDPLTSVSETAAIALQKLQEQLAKVQVPDEDILNRSKSPTAEKTLAEVIDDVIKELENKSEGNSTDILADLNGRCISEQINGEVDLIINNDNTVSGNLTGTLAGKGKISAQLENNSIDVNTSYDDLRAATGSTLKALYQGNFTGQLINDNNNFTIDGTLKIKFINLSLNSSVKDTFNIEFNNNVIITLNEVNKSDPGVQYDLLTNDIVGCVNTAVAEDVDVDPNDTAVPNSCIALSLEDLINLTGINFPSLDTLYDALKAALPLIIKYVPCLATIITLITVIIGIIRTILKIIEILFKIKPIVENIRKIIHSVLPFTGFATIPEVASAVAIAVLAIIKDILLSLPLIFWNIIKTKKIIKICNDGMKPLCNAPQ